MAGCFAIISKPVVLPEDEATGFVDIKTSEEIMELLTRVNREQGSTVTMLTQIQR